MARSEAYATAAPYFVFRPLLRQLAGILPTADREEAGQQLTAWVQGVMPDQAPWLPLLGVVFDAEVEPTPETEALGAVDPAAAAARGGRAVPRCAC